MANEQYAVIEGRTVDMDIETIFLNVHDMDFSDALLNEVFWVIIGTYYKADYERLVTTDMFSVRSMIDLELVRAALIKMQIPYQEALPGDKRLVDCAHILDWELPQPIRVCTRLRMFYGWTNWVPGVNLGHALTLSLVQGARELSSMSLNPASDTGKH